MSKEPRIKEHLSWCTYLATFDGGDFDRHKCRCNCHKQETVIKPEKTEQL